MKKCLLPTLIILLGLLSSCDTEVSVTKISESYDQALQEIEVQKTQKSNTFFINIDKSGSQFGSNSKKAKIAFYNKVKAHFTKLGDEIIVIHTYDSTTDPRNFYQYRLKTPYPDLNINDADEIEYRIANYLADLEIEIDADFKLIFEKHFDPPAIAPRSEILASFFRSSMYMLKHGDTRNYYFLAITDAVEASDIRVFNAKSVAAAKQYGIEDAQTLAKLYDMPSDALQYLKSVTFQLPADSILMVTPQMNFTPEYWTEFTKALGCPVEPIFTGDL